MINLLWLVKLLVQKKKKCRGATKEELGVGVWWPPLKDFCRRHWIQVKARFKIYANGSYNHFISFRIFSSNYFSLVLKEQRKKEKLAFFLNLTQTNGIKLLRSLSLKANNLLTSAARSLCRRFLNQLLTWVDVRPVAAASSLFSRVDGYGFQWYHSFSIPRDFSCWKSWNNFKISDSNTWLWERKTPELSQNSWCVNAKLLCVHEKERSLKAS